MRITKNQLNTSSATKENDLPLTGASIAYLVQRNEKFHVLSTYKGDRVVWNENIKKCFSPFMPKDSSGEPLSYPYHQYPFILPQHGESVLLDNDQVCFIYKASGELSGVQVTCEVIQNWKNKIAKELAKRAAKSEIGPKPAKDADDNTKKEYNDTLNSTVHRLIPMFLDEINSQLEVNAKLSLDLQSTPSMSSYLKAHLPVLNAMKEAGSEIDRNNLQVINIPRGAYDKKHGNIEDCAKSERFEELGISKTKSLPMNIVDIKHGRNNDRLLKLYYQILTEEDLARICSQAKSEFQSRERIHFMSAAEDFWPKDLLEHKAYKENLGFALIPLDAIRRASTPARGTKGGAMPAIRCDVRYPLRSPSNKMQSSSKTSAAYHSGNANTLFTNEATIFYADIPDRHIAEQLNAILQAQLVEKQASSMSMAANK